jgi:hypothetical protein
MRDGDRRDDEQRPGPRSRRPGGPDRRRPLLVGGLALQAAGMGWIALIAAPGLAYGELIAPLVFAVIAASMAIPPAASWVVAAVAQAEVGKAAGPSTAARARP